VIEFRWSRAAAATCLFIAGAAGAQAPAAAKCDINEGKPQQIPLAGLSLSKASMSKDPAERAKNFKDVVKFLTATKENPDARAWYLGQAFSVWMTEPGIPQTFVVTRGALGFTDNPASPVDMLVLTDSLFTALETSQPGCAGQTASWRSQRPWFTSVQLAFAALNADKLDSAAYFAHRSRIINRTSAYGPYVLGQVALRRREAGKARQASPDAQHALADTARELLHDAVRSAGTDTVYSDIRRRSLLDVARISSEEAETAAPTDRKARAAAAVRDLRAFLSEAPTDPDAVPVRAMLADMLLTTADTAGVVSVYADLIGNPAKYSDYEMVQAGVTFTRINRTSEATRMFELALEKNPVQRDALNNLAATYFGAGQFQKMLPLAERLTRLDPNNPDNWLWFGYAYQGMMKPVTGKDPASVKQRKALSDSVVKYSEKSDKMPVRVTFNRFVRGQTETSLEGTIENRGAAEKSYVVTFEFLDVAGNPVEVQVPGTAAKVKTVDVKVDGVKSKGTKDFKLTVGAGGITGFRYKPLD
jgi:tetratricopeptide (TPR) repeat protein